MNCLKCHQGELQAGAASLTYTLEDSAIVVHEDGVPVEVYSVFGEA